MEKGKWKMLTYKKEPKRRNFEKNYSGKTKKK